ncbi:MAG: OadG family protein [Firmicutes bacterium]|jgi:sodium pump decarboxylase gamma subunit|nr:OadG family protein [Bacillota bacterium]MDD4336033.1 OadG family protein [Bacillota bacterium]MDD4793319.1 OadG family protein [Bacillota bacterium]
MTVAEELILGLQTLVLGMAVTFVGLAVLQIIMILMGRASDRNRVAVTSKVPEGLEMPEEPETPVHQGDESDEHVAAIAAVMAILTEEGAAPVRVRSITQVSPRAANLWGLAGRQELMSGRSKA